MVCLIAGALIVSFVVVFLWNYSAPPARIVGISQIPENPDVGEKITIDVEIEGGPPLFSRPSVIFSYMAIGRYGGGGGGGSYSIEGNRCSIIIPPFQDDVHVIYGVAVSDRGALYFSEIGDFDVGNPDYTVSDFVNDSLVLYSINEDNSMITATVLATPESNNTLNNLSLYYMGFASGGEFGGSVEAHYADGYVLATFYANKREWAEGTTLFYCFAGIDEKGNLAISEIERYVVQ